jgi:hypothetical protein
LQLFFHLASSKLLNLLICRPLDSKPVFCTCWAFL